MGNASSRGQVRNGKEAGIRRGKSVLAEKVRRAGASGQLNVDAQNLKALPRALNDLPRLRVLSVQRNKLRELPDDLAARFPDLRTLAAGHNGLEALPDLGGLPRLAHLSCGYNAIATEGVVSLPASLRRLEMPQNRLLAVPPAVLDCSALEVLDLSGNGIVELPEGVAALARLLELYLDENRLSEVPEALSLLQRLKVLSLKRNRIGAVGSGGAQSIPAAVLSGTPVQALELEGNPLRKEQLMAFEGISDFSERRLRKIQKNMQGGAAVDFDFCGLDA